MFRWSDAQRSLTIFSAVLLVTACVSGTPAASVAGTASPPAASASPVPAATPSADPSNASVEPAPASPSLAASVQPPPSSPATAEPPPASPASAEPPPASLGAEGGDPVVGQLGSFTWGDGGSDSPWLPGAPLTVGSGERLTVSIAGGVRVDGWTARRVRAGSTGGSGAVALGSGADRITFTAPGPGVWSVQVTVQFSGDLGSASWYWKLTVR